MIYILGEGHGEPLALSNLVSRLWQDLMLPYVPIHSPAIRFPGLASERGLIKAVSTMRHRPNISGLLVVADHEDECPKYLAPRRSKILSDLDFPFPVAYHVMYREYESLFLPCISQMAGKPLQDARGVKRKGIRQGASFTGNPESYRDAKGIISDLMHDDIQYKPTIDQLPLTRMIDFQALRNSSLPCFGTLERCLAHIANNQVNSGVYPPCV